MTPLREAFLRELALRGMAERTKESYVGAIRQLAEHYRRPPDKLSDRLSDNTTETCNVYNMLGLTRHVFGWNQSCGIGRSIQQKQTSTANRSIINFHELIE